MQKYLKTFEMVLKRMICILRRNSKIPLFRMRAIALLTFLVYTFNLPLGAKAQERVKDYNLHGQVKAMRLDEYSDNGRPISFEVRFDRKGLLIEKSDRVINDSVREYQTVYKYDERDSLALKEVYSPGNVLGYSHAIGYNKEGRRSFEKITDITNSYSQETRYKHDGKGNLAQVDHFIQGKRSSSIFLYDSKGRRVEQTDLSGPGLLQKTTTWEYDDADSSVKIVFCDDEGKVIETKRCKYDSAGRLVSSTFDRGSRSIYGNYRYKYDQNGNVLEHSSYSRDGSGVLSRTRFRYDKLNNVIHIDYSGIDNTRSETTTYKYEYDQEGNWTKMEQFEESSGHPVKTYVRSIEYY
jgi:hypothetical protein